MKSFIEDFLDRQPITHQLLGTIREIGRLKGREDLYQKQVPQVLETLRQVAMVQSVESSNRIEGIIAPLERIQLIVTQKALPNGRSEQEIAGYRDVLSTIHVNHASIPFTPNIVQQFHRDLYRFTPEQGGRWKRADNEIIERHPDGSKRIRFKPVSAFRTSTAMTDLHERFDSLWLGGRYDPLVLIPAYVLDFLCIHPFSDGNGRMARLLTLLLLYKAGYEVGRYISLEMVIEGQREGYYEALERSSTGWHEGRHSLLPWWEYFLGMVLREAYHQLEYRVGMVQGSRGTKTALVLDAVARFVGEFTVSDLRDKCPGVGIDLIRRLLQKERKEGRLSCTGRGPDARWIKV